jgi:hypothetical protein
MEVFERKIARDNIPEGNLKKKPASQDAGCIL